MNINIVKPIIIDVGIIHRYGYGKRVMEDYSNISKKEWDYELPYSLTEKYHGVCECAKIGVNSAMLAYSDSAVIHKADRMSLGVYCGTAFGGFPASQKRQCNALNQIGPKGILPGMSIHSGYHLTADIIAINYHIMGPNMTMASGRLASAMAFLNAYDDIRDNTVQHAIVTGTEFVDDVLIEGLRVTGEKGWESVSSGACTVVLSSDEAVGVTDNLVYVKSIEAQGGQLLIENIKKAVYMALESAELKAEDIGLVVSVQRIIVAERLAISQAADEIFHNRAACPIVFTADIFGDTWGASFVMGVAVAVQEYACRGNVLVVAFDKQSHVLVSIIGR